MNQEMLLKILVCVIFLENHQQKIPYGKIYWNMENIKDNKTEIHVSGYLKEDMKPVGIDLYRFRLNNLQIENFSSLVDLDKKNSHKNIHFLLIKSIGYLLEKKIYFNDLCFSIIEVDKLKVRTFISVKDVPDKPFRRDILFEYTGVKLVKMITGTM
jgi:hypothetical protein